MLEMPSNLNFKIKRNLHQYTTHDYLVAGKPF
jgi:hypothetical protein